MLVHPLLLVTLSWLCNTSLFILIDPLNKMNPFWLNSNHVSFYGHYVSFYRNHVSFYRNHVLQNYNHGYAKLNHNFPNILMKCVLNMTSVRWLMHPP
jgi:hypothetical protein